MLGNIFSSRELKAAFNQRRSGEGHASNMLSSPSVGQEGSAAVVVIFLSFLLFS